jgi:hypothetical protein
MPRFVGKRSRGVWWDVAAIVVFIIVIIIVVLQLTGTVRLFGAVQGPLLA